MPIPNDMRQVVAKCLGDGMDIEYKAVWESGGEFPVGPT